jgi:hypothetical protein
VLLSGGSIGLHDVSATARTGTANYGIRIVGGGLWATNLTAIADGGTTAFGIANETGFLNVRGGYSEGRASGTGAGVLNSNGATSLLQGLNALGFGSLSNGIRNTGSAGGVDIDASVLQGDTSSIGNVSGSTVRVGATKLYGAVNNSGGGIVKCIGVYDGATYTALSATCQ